MTLDWLPTEPSDVIALLSLLVAGVAARSALRQARANADDVDLARRKLALEQITIAHQAQIAALQEQADLLRADVARAMRHTEECETALAELRARLNHGRRHTDAPQE